VRHLESLGHEVIVGPRLFPGLHGAIHELLAGNGFVIAETSRSAAVISVSQSPDSATNGHANGHRQLDLIEVAAGLRPVVEFLLELERTVADGVEDRCDHLQMRSRILQLP
jgi:hypothetical protein